MATRRDRFDEFLDALEANKLIEIESAGRSPLKRQLARIDEDDERELERKVLKVLATSRWIIDVYASDEQLVAEIGAMLLSKRSGREG
jgi:hypothetical protein